jgi:hypothetical protein
MPSRSLPAINMVAILAVTMLVARLSVEDVASRPIGAAIDIATYKPPRTPWGEPDLQGAYTNADERGTPMERPESLSGRRRDRMTPAELRRLQEARNRNLVGAPIEWEPIFEGHPSNRRAWLVVDPPNGRIPPLTPDAARRRNARAEVWRQRGATAPWLSVGFFGRCITRGMPESMLPWLYGNVYEITQSPGFVAIRYEMVNETRVIPLDGRPPLDTNIRSYMGDARGHFESDSLVVETTNFAGEPQYRGSSRDLRLIERFTPTSPDRVEWRVTLHDTATWTRPWTFAVDLTRTSGRPLEFACHEGNYALRNLLSANLTRMHGAPHAAR